MKYTITMSCGHEDTVDLIGKNTEREKRLEYYKNCGLCKECYKKSIREKEKNEGFNFNGAIEPHVDEQNGHILINVWFEGDTMPHKDEIKELGGYRWCERVLIMEDIPRGWKTPICWNKIIDLKELKTEEVKACSIGANILISHKELVRSYNFREALMDRNDWKEKQKKLESIPKPEVPVILKDHNWNQKIYGGTGNYSIYLDNEKVIITDTQATELEHYLNEKKEYKKKIERIRYA